MCTRNELDNVLNLFVDGVRNLFDDKLKDVILYGSYARGDFDNESDVDVAVIVDIPK